jgi:hypothetical protein
MKTILGMLLWWQEQVGGDGRVRVYRWQGNHRRRGRHNFVFDFEIGSHVDEFVDEAELQEVSRIVESGPGMLRWGSGEAPAPSDG